MSWAIMLLDQVSSSISYKWRQDNPLEEGKTVRWKNSKECELKINAELQSALAQRNIFLLKVAPRKNMNGSCDPNPWDKDLKRRPPLPSDNELTPLKVYNQSWKADVWKQTPFPAL